MASPWIYPGLTLNSLWTYPRLASSTYLGPTLNSALTQSRIVLPTHFGLILNSTWTHVGLALDSPLDLTLVHTRCSILTQLEDPGLQSWIHLGFIQASPWTHSRCILDLAWLHFELTFYYTSFDTSAFSYDRFARDHIAGF